MINTSSIAAKADTGVKNDASILTNKIRVLRESKRGGRMEAVKKEKANIKMAEDRIGKITWDYYTAKARRLQSSIEFKRRKTPILPSNLTLAYLLKIIVQSKLWHQ